MQLHSHLVMVSEHLWEDEQLRNQFLCGNNGTVYKENNRNNYNIQLVTSFTHTCSHYAKTLINMTKGLEKGVPDDHFTQEEL